MPETELTAAEQAYLNSGGADAAGLIAENPASVVEKVDNTTEHPIEPDKAPATAEVKPAVTAAEPAAVDAPEPGEEEVPAADGKSKRRMVDSRALKAERTARAAAEAELKAERETRARIDERLKMLSEAVSSADPAAAEVAEPVIPDLEQDIFGYAKYLAAELEKVKTSQHQTQAETADERQTRAVISTYVRDRDAFVAKQPDFMDGYNFLLSTRKSQLELQGYSPEDVNKWLHKEEMDLVTRSLQNKKSPSEQVYALAKSMGYAPTPAGGGGSGGAAPAAAKPAPTAPLAAPSVVDEIDRIKAGKAASMSLSNGGGGGAEEMSLEWLANAPLKEFEAFMNKPGNREKVERAMGSKAA